MTNNNVQHLKVHRVSLDLFYELYVPTLNDETQTRDVPVDKTLPSPSSEYAHSVSKAVRFLSAGPEPLSRQVGTSFGSGTSTVCFHVGLVLSREGTRRLSNAGGN